MVLITLGGKMGNIWWHIRNKGIHEQRFYRFGAPNSEWMMMPEIRNDKEETVLGIKIITVVLDLLSRRYCF